MEDGLARHPCPFCGRSFGSPEARYQHAQAKHRGLPLRAILPHAANGVRAKLEQEIEAAESFDADADAGEAAA